MIIHLNNIFQFLCNKMYDGCMSYVYVKYFIDIKTIIK